VTNGLKVVEEQADLERLYEPLGQFDAVVHGKNLVGYSLLVALDVPRVILLQVLF